VSSFILGAGRVGRTLIRLLQSAGEPITGASNRTPQRAQQTTRLLGIRSEGAACPVIPPSTRIVWLTVPDREIGQAARCVAPQLDPNAILVHTSGTIPSSMVRSHAPDALSVAGAHPLQTLTGAPEDLDRIRESHWFLEGEELALESITTLLQRLGMSAHLIPPEQRPIYHAAAVLASNAVIGLHGTATRLLIQAGVEEAHAAAALAPLMRATLANLQEKGAAGALTGPVARGDVGVIASHLDVLGRDAPEAAALYRALLEPLVEVARAHELAGPELLNAIDRLRKESPEDSS